MKIIGLWKELSKPTIENFCGSSSARPYFFSVPFYAQPQRVCGGGGGGDGGGGGGFYVKLPDILNVHQSIHPSSHPSVYLYPLHNSDTIQDIFMELGTNIMHHQPMCTAENKNHKSFIIWGIRLF